MIDFTGMSSGPAHARLGPSNKRWPHCPGSVREEANYEDVPGAAAIDGTGSHTLLELCLNNNVRAEDYDRQIIGVNHPDRPGGWLVDKERCERVQMALDYVTRRVKELKEQYPHGATKVLVESRANPGKYFERDDWWGTVDVTIIVYHVNDTRLVLFLEVCDFKDGRGYVSEKDNSQLISYCFGKLCEVKWPELVKGVRMTIVQPKTGKPVRYQDTTAKHVTQLAKELGAAAALTDDPQAPLVPDDKNGKGHCRWCKHRENCSALNNVGIGAIKIMTEEITPVDNKPMFEVMAESTKDLSLTSSEKLSELFDTRDAVLAIYDKIEKEIERRVNQGFEVPGYGMQPGRGSKVYAAEEDVIFKKLKAVGLKKDEIYPPKLISPAQLLKLDKLTDRQKERLEKELIVFKAGDLKLKKLAREKQVATVDKLFAGIEHKSVAQSSDNVVQSVVSFL